MLTHLVKGSLAALVLAAAAAPASAQTVYGKPSSTTGSNYDRLLRYWIDNYGFAGTEPEELQSGVPTYTFELLSKAPKDECYVDIGLPSAGLPPCPAGSREKANQTYVWGMAFDQSTNTVWWGTGANVQCTAAGSYLGSNNPDENSDYVCEYGDSQLVQQVPFWPAELGDFRPARVYSMNVSGAVGGTVIDRTGDITGGSSLLRNTTLGFRGVGIHNGVVLLGGPNVGPFGGINLFAFSTNGNFLGSTTLFQYSNLRKFLVVDGVMYLGVLNGILNPNPGGSILRWTGNSISPFQFEVVGLVDTEVSELTVNTEPSGTKRLVASTWSRLFGAVPFGDAHAGLFASPPIPFGGLTNANANQWTNIWRAENYEPDDVTALALAGGALAAFDGWVYWGLLQTPGLGVLAWIEEHGNPTSNQQFQRVIAGTFRQTPVLRGRIATAGGVPSLTNVELLYGLRQLPVYDTTSGLFVLRPNRTGPALNGLAGLNNMYNVYLWSMQVSDGLLYLGTFDYSYLRFGIGPDTNPNSLLPSEFTWIGERNWGADLWVIAPGSSQARKVDTRGLGNITNYGIRTMVSANGLLYCGTANPSTLKPEGGWELIRVRPPTN